MELSSQAQDKTHADAPWVKTLSDWLSNTYPDSVTRARTMLSCDIKASKPALFLPPDMAELQPNGLEYLRAFAKAHKFTLMEDRRRVKVQPMLERRNRTTPMIANAIGELLNTAGLRGDPPALSTPHRLNDDSPHICITQLLRMAAFSSQASKRTVLPSNSKLINVLNNDTQPVTAFACKLKASESTTILSHFEAPQFRAIGYSAGRQYIVHVCLAGGPLHNPQLWTGIHTLTRTDFQFQLIQSPKKSASMGLFYTTFYFDMQAAHAPWWVNESIEQHNAGAAPVLLSDDRRVSDRRNNDRRAG